MTNLYMEKPKWRKTRWRKVRRCKTTCVVNEKTNIVNKKNKNLTKKKLQPNAFDFNWWLLVWKTPGNRRFGKKVLCQLQTVGTPFNAVSLGRIIGTETKYFPGKSNCSYIFPLICRVFSGSGILQITVGWFYIEF